MKVVVAGGTGFIGRHIVRELVARGHDVGVMGRDPARVSRIPELAGATARRGDVTDPATLAAALEGTEVVVSAVQFPGHPAEVPRRDRTYDRFDRRATIDLLGAARTAGARRFVYVSGAGADVTSDKPWYRAKGLGERVLAEGDLEYAILRPSWAYGRGDRAINRFILAARLSPFVPIIGLRDQYIQPVYAGDVGRAIAEMVTSDAAAGRTFEIGSREVVTMHRVMEVLLDVMGRRRVIVRVPKIVAQAVTAPLVLLPSPPMTPRGIDFATQDGLVDVGPMVAALGVEPLPLHDGLATYLAS